jgi:hypothetical protein
VTFSTTLDHSTSVLGVGVKVQDPSGQTFRVTRRWVPWRRRLKADLAQGLDAMPTGLGDDPVSAVIALVFLVLALPFLLLALLVGRELLLVLLLVPFAVLARALFGQHWTVEVRKGFSIWWEAPSGDWQESGVLIHDVALAIRKGDPLPQPADAEPEPWSDAGPT